MNILNLDLTLLGTPEFLGAEPTDRATWLCLLNYCARQETGGMIRECDEWGDRKWQQIAAVTREEVHRKTDLWRWEGDKIHVWGYPSESEARLLAKRDSATANARTRWANLQSNAKSSKPKSIGNANENDSHAKTDAVAYAKPPISDANAYAKPVISDANAYAVAMHKDKDKDKDKGKDKGKEKVLPTSSDHLGLTPVLSILHGGNDHFIAEAGVGDVGARPVIGAAGTQERKFRSERDRSVWLTRAEFDAELVQIVEAQRVRAVGRESGRREKFS